VAVKKRRSTAAEEHVIRQLLTVIANSGMSHYQIGKETEIDQATISKFCNGHQGMRLDTFSRLCGFFRLELCRKE